MSEDIVARLRAADEWMLVGLEGLAFHSDAPFDAADEIERLRAELAAEREKAFTAMRVFERYRELEAQVAAAEAERDAMRELLREARNIMPRDWAFWSRIDAALKGGDRD